MEEKKPKEMDPMELIEAFSHYTKMSFRSISEQEYLAQIRIELLERLGYYKEESNK